MPVTRSKNVVKYQVKVVDLNFETKLMFKNSEIQSLFTNSTTLQVFSGKSVIHQLKIFFYNSLVANNHFLIQLKDEVRDIFGTQKKYLYRSQYLKFLHTIVRLESSPHKCIFKYGKDIELYACIAQVIRCQD